MGKQWKKDGKVANAAKKGAVFTKLSKEISVATKLGGPDPGMNTRLRLAIEAAKKASVPKDTIERAIKRGSGASDEAQIEELTYEGFGPHRVGILVECQTDNRNRTASELKTYFKKNEGNLGELGSVAWMFKRVSKVVARLENGQASVDAEAEAIEAGADSVESTGEGFEFLGSPEDLGSIQTALSERGWVIESAELGYVATQKTESLSEAQTEEVIEFLSGLDDLDDTHRIYATLD